MRSNWLSIQGWSGGRRSGRFRLEPVPRVAPTHLLEQARELDEVSVGSRVAWWLASESAFGPSVSEHMMVGELAIQMREALL